jgi:hypothetical protein
MLQTLASLGELLGGMAVIVGVVFAVIQMRQYKGGKAAGDRPGASSVFPDARLRESAPHRLRHAG